jgi:hypothetical protein
MFEAMDVIGATVVATLSRPSSTASDEQAASVSRRAAGTSAVREIGTLRTLLQRCGSCK